MLREISQFTSLVTRVRGEPKYLHESYCNDMAI
jgi:hypothetical protein